MRYPSEPRLHQSGLSFCSTSVHSCGLQPHRASAARRRRAVLVPEMEKTMSYRHVLRTRFGEPADAFQLVEDTVPEPEYNGRQSVTGGISQRQVRYRAGVRSKAELYT